VEYSPEGLPLGVNIQKTLKRALSHHDDYIDAEEGDDKGSGDGSTEEKKLDGKSHSKDLPKKQRQQQQQQRRRPHPAIAAVVLVSPSYHGVVCDVAGASEACKEAGVYPLIVDEAHGAHLKFMTSTHSSSSAASQPTQSPSASLVLHEKRKNAEAAALRGALFNGADVVVQSTHKTLTALTQVVVTDQGGGKGSFSTWSSGDKRGGVTTVGMIVF